MRQLDLRGLITIAELQEIMKVSDVTIWRWRKNTDLNRCVVEILGYRKTYIRFDLKCVTKWAAENNKPMTKMGRASKDNRPKNRVRM